MHTLLTLIASGTSDIETDVSSISIKAVLVSSLILVVLLAFAAIVVKDKKHEAMKLPVFIAIAATIILPSLFLVGSTVYINTVSESNGPVHWHTDFEFWVCGEEIELRDPYAFLSNKIGTSSYHEHDDKRIHLEGVVVEKNYDASFEKFMLVAEGRINPDELIIATEESVFENDTDGDVPDGNQDVVRQFVVRDKEGKPEVFVRTGDTCGDSQPGEIQGYLYRYNNSTDTYEQTKLEDPSRYIMRDESLVPPGDCLIIEFGPSKEYTDRLCQQYGVRDSKRCTEFGVEQYNEELCNITEIREVQLDEPEPEVEIQNITEETSNDIPEECLTDPDMNPDEQAECIENQSTTEAEL